MNSDEDSALPTIQWIMIIILVFMVISYKAETVQLHKDLKQLQHRCQELTQEAENGP